MEAMCRRGEICFIQELVRIKPEVPVEADLNSWQGRRYELSLEAGQFLRLVVEQKGIDVVVRFSRPDGKSGRVDSPNGPAGLEIVYDIAETSGTYQVEVFCEIPAVRPGRFEMRLDKPRPATENDQQHFAAWRTFRKGERHRRDGSSREALGSYQEALAIWRELDDGWWRAETLTRIGWMHQDLGGAREGLAALQEALPLLRGQHRRLEEGITLNRIGRCRFLLGEYTQSLELGRQALVIFRAAKAPDLEASALNNLGNACVPQGEFQRALESFQEALTLAGEAQIEVEKATALFGIGDVLLIQGKIELALDHLEKALKIYHRLNEKADEAATLLRIANAKQRLGDLENARRNLEKALELEISRGDRGGEARVRNSLGTLYLLSKQTEPARENYQRALDLSRQTMNRYEEAVALHSLARLAYEMDEARQAYELHEQAARLFREIGNRPRQVSALFGSARALHRLGEDAEANLRLERVLASIEDLRTAADSIDLRTGFLATKQRYYDLHIDVLMCLHEKEPEKGYDGRALYVNERRRVRGLLDLLTEGGNRLRRGVDPTLLEREESLHQSINALDLRIMSLGEAELRESAALEREQRELLLALDEVRTRIGRQNPLILRKPETLTFPEIQQRVLGESSLLLIYALGEERSLLWLVPHQGEIETHRLPSRSRIESLARQAHWVLQRRGGRARGERWLFQLSKMLLEPAAERLGEKRLVIVADEALESLPFAALPDPRQEGPEAAQPLIARHEIVYLPSASVLATIRRDLADRLPAPRRLAMLADPVFSPDDPRLSGITVSQEPFESLQQSARNLSIGGFERLPYTEEEAEAIRELLPEEQRFEATGFQASRETVLSGQLRRYRILHFATHGLLNPNHPELSRLVLSLYDEKGRTRDGFLRAYEISNLDLQAELAVLSACQTGLGQEARGEGLLGMTRSFMYAGVPRVIVSLWNVSDEGTAALMSRFYRGLFEEKLRPPEALRCAQLSMLKDERFSDPYYWAPFVFQGEWRLEIRSSDGGIEQRVGGSGAGTRSDDDLPPPLQRASSKKSCPDLD